MKNYNQIFMNPQITIQQKCKIFLMKEIIGGNEKNESIGYDCR